MQMYEYVEHRHDAINHTNFESPILCKEDKYQSLIVMKLKNDFDE